MEIKYFKKNWTVKNEKIISDKFDLSIEILNDLKESYKFKKQDTIYNISSIKETNLLKNENKIEEIAKELENKKSKIEYLLNDKQIDNIKFKELIENAEKEHFNKKNKTINDLKIKREKYITKVDLIIANKRKKFKEQIQKFDLNIDNKINKLEQQKKLAILKIIDKNSELLKNAENNLIAQKNERLLKSKEFMAIEKFEEDYKQNKFGDLTYRDKKQILEENLEKRIKKIDSFENFALKKMTLKVANVNFLSEQRKMKFRKEFFDILQQGKLLIIILLIAIVAGFSNQYFFTARTWINLLTNNLDLLMIAFGMTLIILTGGIDLSVGSVLAFSGAVLVKMLEKNYNIYLSILIGLSTATAFGLIAGWLISYVKLQPFIVTLVFMLALRGSASILLESKATPLPSETLQFLTQPFIGKMPLTFFISLVIFALLFVLMKYYKYGRYVYAVGGNAKASKLSGLKTNLIANSVYVFSGALVFVGTIFYISKLNSIAPTSGNQMELDAIACVALGGTSLIGGKGGVTKTLIGWFVICVLSTAMNMIGIDSYYQMIVKGAVILVAVLSDKKFDLYNKTKKMIMHFAYRM